MVPGRDRELGDRLRQTRVPRRLHARHLLPRLDRQELDLVGAATARWRYDFRLYLYRDRRNDVGNAVFSPSRQLLHRSTVYSVMFINKMYFKLS